VWPVRLASLANGVEHTVLLHVRARGGSDGLEHNRSWIPQELSALDLCWLGCVRTGLK